MPGAVSAAFPPRPEQPDSARRGPGRAPGERAPEEGGRLRFRRWEGKRERRGEGVKRRRKKKKEREIVILNGPLAAARRGALPRRGRSPRVCQAALHPRCRLTLGGESRAAAKREPGQPAPAGEGCCRGGLPPGPRGAGLRPGASAVSGGVRRCSARRWLRVDASLLSAGLTVGSCTSTLLCNHRKGSKYS